MASSSSVTPSTKTTSNLQKLQAEEANGKPRLSRGLPRAVLVSGPSFDPDGSAPASYQRRGVRKPDTDEKLQAISPNPGPTGVDLDHVLSDLGVPSVDASARPHVAGKMDNEPGLVETELARARIWPRMMLLTMPITPIPNRRFGTKEMRHLVLRYLFNKIVSLGAATPSDPVFMTHDSPLAREQLEADFSYFKITNLTATQMADQLERRFAYGLLLLQEERTKGMIAADQKSISMGPSLTETFFQPVYYRGKAYDVGESEGLHPEHLHALIALRIRYDYLHLDTHGLANPYAAQGHKPGDRVLEAFANPFNRYFDAYHSAFPDLEARLGSRGSFFAATRIEEPLVMANPPFDVSVMRALVMKAFQCLDTAKAEKREQTFILTLPAWRDVDYLKIIAASEHLVSIVWTPKADTTFIDSSTGAKIQPCDILTVTLRVKLTGPA